MFIQLFEKEDQQRRLWIARHALAEVGAYPTRIAPPKRQTPLPVPQRETQRGVYEVEFPPAGYRAFNIVDSHGDAGYIQFPAHWVTRDFVKNLWRRLDTLDPPTPALKLHGSSEK